MKIKSTITGALYEFTPAGKGDEVRSTCPECSHLRKKKTDKCFAWNNKTDVGYCHNCTASFYVFKPTEGKQYIAPEWKNITELSDRAVKWFTGRMISQNTLVKMKIYTSREYMPQFNKEVETICMPYFFQGKLYNIKYRGGGKSFKMHSGAELIFYNQDALLNYEDIIIVEGEFDALAFIECGFDNVISVPNGAHGKLEYLDTYYNLFENVQRIFIAVDQDTEGVKLRDELVRRLGAERCLLVGFKDCKDANEYLIKYGGIEFPALIKEARYVPIKGIIHAEHIGQDILSFYEKGVPPGKILHEAFDEYVSWETGRLAVVTGIPSSGKSEFIDHLVVKMSICHGWKSAFFTPENYPLKYHYSKLFEKIIGKKFSRGTSTELDYEMAFEYINDNFFYILNEDDFTIDSVLIAAKVLVKSKGIKVLVIDPYNRLEHQYKDSETQYISRFLDKLTSFARLNDVLVILVAHPRKMDKDATGRLKVPSLYDINGSSNFYNKADYGFTVHRKSDGRNILLNEVEIHWQKIKFKYLGKQGISELKYNYVNGRFQRDTNWDNTNWLIKNIEQRVIDYSQPTSDINDDFFKETIVPIF
jgi:twinkle protein